MDGLTQKYHVEKTDGAPIDPNAKYFVLRYDTDEAAQWALLEYARRTPNLELAQDILRALADENSPAIIGRNV